MLGELSKTHESNGNPACISSGEGDGGGKSYGMYQFSSKYNIPVDFANWMAEQDLEYGKRLLNAGEYYSWFFDEVWKDIANENNEHFAYLQHEYTKIMYYDVAKSILLDKYNYNLENHSEALKNVIWSMAVQYSPYVMNDFVSELKENYSIDDMNTIIDEQLIDIIYDIRKKESWMSGSPDLQEGLIDRFNQEHDDAIEMLRKEGL